MRVRTCPSIARPRVRVPIPGGLPVAPTVSTLGPSPRRGRAGCLRRGLAAHGATAGGRGRDRERARGGPGEIGADGRGAGGAAGGTGRSSRRRAGRPRRGAHGAQRPPRGPPRGAMTGGRGAWARSARWRRGPPDRGATRAERADAAPRPIQRWGWRRRWDSNPRYAFAHAGFQDRCVRPLRHSSGGVLVARRPSGANRTVAPVPAARGHAGAGLGGTAAGA